jgi:hypothetical protein
LENAGEQAACFCRQGFHQKRRAQPPFASHADAKQGPQNQEHGKTRRERGEHFDHRIKNDVRHQRNSASEAVAQESKEQRADWAEHEGQHAGESDFGDSPAEFLCDSGEHEGKQEKIERVQGPAEETGDERVSLIAGQRFEKPQRFHLRERLV